MSRAVVVLAAALLALAAPAAASCPVPDGATHVARGSKAVAYVVRHGDSGWLYGCLRSVGERVKVEAVYTDIDANHVHTVRVAGRFVAYVDVFESHYFTEETSIESFDIREREPRWRSEVAESDGDAGDVAVVKRLLLAKNGAFAYFARRRYEDGTEPPAPWVRQLRARDRPGDTDRLLDSGEGIDRESIALSGRTLTWLNDGEGRSATLRR